MVTVTVSICIFPGNSRHAYGCPHLRKPKSKPGVIVFFPVISLMYSLLIDIVIQFLDPHEYQEATTVT